MGKQHHMWSHIDGVLVVNLDKNPERMEHFMEVNAPTMPLEKVERLSAVYGRDLPGFGAPPWFMPRTMERAGYWAGAAGCTLSHRNAIKTAKEKGWRNVLIMEDDAVTQDMPDAMQLLDEIFPLLTGQYMLYFGYSRPTPYGKCVKKVGKHGLWQTEGVLSTFAYLVPESMYDLLLAEMPTDENVWEWHSIHRAIDSFYRDTVAARHGVKMYVIQPDLILHVDGASDINGKNVVYDRYDRNLEPLAYASVKGLWHVLMKPFHRLKVKLNAVRTHRRAIKGGFPGFKKRKK